MLLFILLYVSVTLRRFRGISAAEAVRFGMQSTVRTKAVRLSNSNRIPINLFLGIRDVWARKRLYATMLAVVILAAFIIMCRRTYITPFRQMILSLIWVLAAVTCGWTSVKTGKRAKGCRSHGLFGD